MTSFLETVRSLDLNDPRANITAIKGAVKEKLQDTDSRVQVSLTDHFNHSFVPDLVLSWPGSKDSRRVFLRTTFREDEIARDLDLLGEERPILMSLDRLPDRAKTGEAVQTRAKVTNSLVADPYGLEALDREATSKPVVTLLSHAVLQGGRGVMSASTAQASGKTVDAGFEAARAGDPTGTSAAVDDAADLLDTARAIQINRLLHAVWLGSGKPSSAFPGAAGVTAVLDAESLRFVLQLPDIDDDDFWVRLGSGLTTNRLCELRDFPQADNFQRLVQASAHKLIAKACRAIKGQGAPSEAPTWSVRGGNLVLSVANDLLHFAPRAIDELPTSSDEAPQVLVDQLQRRAQSAGLRLGEVRLSDGDHVISYGAEADADVAYADALGSLQNLVPNATLTSATAFTGSKEVRCTFRTRTAAGNSSARFTLSELAGVAVPLLVAPGPDLENAVRELLTKPALPSTDDVDETGPVGDPPTVPRSITD